MDDAVGELNRAGRNRDVRSVVVGSEVLLYERGLLRLWRAGKARTKCGTWWKYGGNMDAAESLPVDHWCRMTYSRWRITDWSDRNHEGEISGRINPRQGKARRILCENIAFEIRPHSYYAKDWWLCYIFMSHMSRRNFSWFNSIIYITR